MKGPGREGRGGRLLHRSGGWSFWVGLLDGPDQLFEMRGQDVEKDRLLIRIVMIEERLRDAAATRDHFHRCPDVSRYGEELSRAVQDKLTFVVVVLGAGSSHIFFRCLPNRRLADLRSKSIKVNFQITQPGKSAGPC